MWTFVSIAVGGTFGCWSRYAMTLLLQGVLGRAFPFATMAINIIGSFAMGFLFILTLERLSISPFLRTAILTGFLGGFTTFSTFEMETLLLVQEGANGKAILYIALSVILGFIGAFLGVYAARNI